MHPQLRGTTSPTISSDPSWFCAERWVDAFDLFQGLPKGEEAWKAYEGSDEHVRCITHYEEWKLDGWVDFRLFAFFCIAHLHLQIGNPL